VLALGLSFVASLCAGCAKKSATSSAPNPAASTTATSPSKVTLALNWVPEPEFGGFYAGREGKDYAKHGVDIEILGGGAGFPVLQMVATGRADFGTVGGDELVIGRARGADVVAVFATYQTNPQGIMVHAARKLGSLPEVFRSGTLALETGLAYAAYLKGKFPWQGVKIVPYDGGVAHFLADPEFGQQCYVTSEPLAAKRKGADPQVFLVADAGYNPYATVVITRRALLQKKPELVREFVQATAEGWRRYLDDPTPTNALLGRLNPAMDAASLADAATAQKPLIETADTRQSGLGSMQKTRWETLASQLLDLKLIEQKPNVDELFVNSKR
jgi:NitT/TauT family transport system substrate-binding protein